jgi:hypothetical protein
MGLPRDYDVDPEQFRLGGRDIAGWARPPSIARFVPPERAADRAARISTPVTVTKRGAFIRARKD